MAMSSCEILLTIILASVYLGWIVGGCLLWDRLIKHCEEEDLP